MRFRLDSLDSTRTSARRRPLTRLPNSEQRHVKELSRWNQLRGGLANPRSRACIGPMQSNTRRQPQSRLQRPEQTNCRRKLARKWRETWAKAHRKSEASRCHTAQFRKKKGRGTAVPLETANAANAANAAGATRTTTPKTRPGSHCRENVLPSQKSETSSDLAAFHGPPAQPSRWSCKGSLPPSKPRNQHSLCARFTHAWHTLCALSSLRRMASQPRPLHLLDI